jgi:hypothetical protein
MNIQSSQNIDLAVAIFLHFAPLASTTPTPGIGRIALKFKKRLKTSSTSTPRIWGKTRNN